MSEWIAALVRHVARGESAVIVTVASTRGSVPRGPGTRMIVARDAIHGTIGGGHLEMQAIAIARDLLASAERNAERMRRFPLGASLGQCCGGVVNLLFEPVTAPAPWLDAASTCVRDRRPFVLASPTRGMSDNAKLLVTAGAVAGSLGAIDGAAIAAARALLAEGAGARLVRCGEGDLETLLFLDAVDVATLRVVLFGAGHVGRALVRVLADVPCELTWIDSRDDAFPAEVPTNATVVCTDAPEAEVDAAPAGSAFVVMTHSHALDEAIAERILKRADYLYFGLIGSQPKRRQFERRLAARGISAERFATMTCPIGVPGIEGKEPAIIAIAVAAQLLEVRSSALAANRTDAGRDAAAGPDQGRRLSA